MNRALIAALLVFGLIGGGFLVAGDSFSTITNQCVGEVLEIDGQQFSSMSEAESFVNSNLDVDFTEFKDKYDVCVKDGQVMWDSTPGDSQ